MVKKLSNKENEKIILSLIAMAICYNLHELADLFFPADLFIGFPLFTDHKEPIAWYVKDIGFRVSIAILSVLLLYLERDRVNLAFRMLLRATTGFLVKDVFDYVICYDQFPALWDILFYMSIVLYVLFASKAWNPENSGYYS